MRAQDEPGATAPPPSAAALEAMPSDAWAVLLPHLRAVLADLDDAALPPEAARWRDAPTGRLAGGRGRRELCRELAAGGQLWAELAARLRGHGELPPAVDELVAAPSTGVEPQDPEAATEGSPAGVDQDAERTERLRQRLRAARQDRDAWRRRAEGAEVRAEGLEQRLVEARDELERANDEADELRRRLEAADEERRQAIDRERRRRDGEVIALREQLAALRRTEEQRRAEQRRREEGRQAAAEQVRADEERDRRTVRGSTPRVVPGRPTRLPDGIAANTTEAVDLLLHAGRVVLVDGYNLTRRHRAELDLEGQRSWVVTLLATLAAQRRVRPIVVFDGERAGGARSATGAREVDVRFTPAGVTADDDIVFAVEGTDEPVLVVTDDRELADRVRACGADVVGTTPFLGAAR